MGFFYNRQQETSFVCLTTVVAHFRQARTPRSAAVQPSWTAAATELTFMLSWVLERWRDLDLSWQQVVLSLALGALTFLISTAAAIMVLVNIPADYFQDPRPLPSWAVWHPILRTLIHVVKNVLGVLVVLIGMILALPGVPGPGLLLIFIGVLLLDFPGKRRLEQKLVGRPQILGTINRIRARFDKPPLKR